MLEGWSNIVAHVAAHFICGGLMIPVVLAGDWSAAPPRAQTWFVLGALGDVGFDLYHGLKTVLAVFADKGLLARFGWERVPPIMVPLTILHHTLAIAMVIPMNAKYIELADYRTTCFSLLFAAAVCFSLNSYKMTLDVTKRTPFLAFKAILVVQVGTIVYTRVILWFPTCARMLSHFADAGDTMYYRGGLCAAGLMTLFNLAILNDAVGGPESVVDAVDAPRAGRHLRQVDPEAAARAHDARRQPETPPRALPFELARQRPVALGPVRPGPLPRRRARRHRGEAPLHRGLGPVSEGGLATCPPITR